jgi:hypothetical protein
MYVREKKTNFKSIILNISFLKSLAKTRSLFGKAFGFNIFQTNEPLKYNLCWGTLFGKISFNNTHVGYKPTSN